MRKDVDILQYKTKSVSVVNGLIHAVDLRYSRTAAGNMAT